MVPWDSSSVSYENTSDGLPRSSGQVAHVSGLGEFMFPSWEMQPDLVGGWDLEAASSTFG